MNPQLDDAGSVVVTTGDPGGTAPPGWGDVQPATDRVSTTIHIADMRREIFIRISPLLIQQIPAMLFRMYPGQVVPLLQNIFTGKVRKKISCRTR